MVKRCTACFVLLCTSFSCWVYAQQLNEPLAVARTKPDLVLTGEIKGDQNRTYLEVPFQVPVDVHRVSVDFTYTGKDQKTTLDLGIADPQRFRGASGGNKSHFTLSESDATPSYLPGAIPAGQWHLLISVPNIRAASISRYQAEIRFNDPVEDSQFTLQPLANGKRWYRGDLHMHTAHSDANCRSQSGRKTPCPLFLTVQAAAARSLDFIAITDHNTDSHYAELRELQPFFDRLLLIPGREITTFHGHFNIFGVTEFVDWRAGKDRDLNDIVRDVIHKGGIASVNHADAPGGEVCMGCRWEAPAGTDMGLFSAVEVINYGEIMFSSAKYWDSQLRAGHRLAAVGGSDSHDATIPVGEPGAVGWPATVVEADGLSVAEILKGIRAGRTFVDETSSRDKILDFDATLGSTSANMGGNLKAAAGGPASLHVYTHSTPGSVAHVFLDGEEPAPPIAISAADTPAHVNIPAGRHWLRIEVRDSTGASELISSPLYINFPEEP